MEEKKIALKRMKRIALSALILAGLLLLFAKITHIEWLKSFCEAAVVGGMADWFAVVALFRQPLGLPIPHTALIPRNKNSIGDNLGKFVSEEFLTKEHLLRQFEQHNIAVEISSWLSKTENATKISHIVAAHIIPDILNFIQDDDVKRFIRSQTELKLSSLNISEYLGKTLELMVKDGRHQKLLSKMFDKLQEEFDDAKPFIYGKIKAETPWYTMGLLDDKLYDGIVDAVAAWLEDAKEHGSEVREKIEAYMLAFIHNLKKSKDMKKSVDNLLQSLLNNVELQNYLDGIWTEIKNWITNDLSKDESSHIKLSISTMVQTFAKSLSQDKILLLKINKFFKDDVLSLLVDNRVKIGEFIASTVRSWDAKEISDKIELEVGKDLQYIRLNGTLVGGFIGLGLYIMSILIS